MATSSDMSTALRDANAIMLGAYREQSKTSLFEGLFEDMETDKGYVRVGVIHGNPKFREFFGEMRPDGLTSAGTTQELKLYKCGLSIPRKTLKHVNSVLGRDEVTSIAREMVMDSIANRDQLLTTYLEANGNDILGSAFFAAAASIPNSPDGETLTNTQTGSGVDTVAKITADYDSGMSLLTQMKNAAGRLYHGPNVRMQKPIIMYPSALNSIMEQTFRTPLLAAGGNNTMYDRAVLRENPLLTDANDWFLFLPNPRYKALILAHSGAPSLESDAGGDAQQRSRDSMIHHDFVFASDDEILEYWGDRHGVIRTTNT